MESVKVTILGKQYPLKVNPDDVDNMHLIAEYVDEKFKLYRRELHKQPETTVMVLAALSIAEELFETRRKARENSGNEDEVWSEVNSSIKRLLEDLSKE